MELSIRPDKSDGEARASLHKMRIEWVGRGLSRHDKQKAEAILKIASARFYQTTLAPKAMALHGRCPIIRQRIENSPACDTDNLQEL